MKSYRVISPQDLERNYMNFEDDFINIQVQMKGGRDENGAKITINTDFCLQIVWDTRMSLYVSQYLLIGN